MHMWRAQCKKLSAKATSYEYQLTDLHSEVKCKRMRIGDDGRMEQVPPTGRFLMGLLRHFVGVSVEALPQASATLLA